MPFESVIQALADTWHSVIGELEPESVERLRTLVAQLASADAEEQEDAALDIADLLSRELPAAHPVRRAIAEEDSLLLSSGASGRLPDLLVTRLGQNLAYDSGSQAKTRLLSAPMRSADGDRLPDNLIRLADRDGDHFPAFQFDPAGRPLAVVLTVNELLGAAADPWGVADWWLGGNAWLGGRTPAEVLGSDTADQVLALARSIVEED